MDAIVDCKYSQMLLGKSKLDICSGAKSQQFYEREK